MKLHEFLILISGAIFSGIVAIDTILKNRKAAYRNRMESKTRREILDEIDQKEWDTLLARKYPCGLFWCSM